MEDYGELFAATRKWVESKRNEVAKRNFPNSVAEMKVRVHSRAVIMHVPKFFYKVTQKTTEFIILCFMCVPLGLKLPRLCRVEPPIRDPPR